MSDEQQHANNDNLPEHQEESLCDDCVEQHLRAVQADMRDNRVCVILKDKVVWMDKDHLFFKCAGTCGTLHPFVEVTLKDTDSTDSVEEEAEAEAGGACLVARAVASGVVTTEAPPTSASTDEPQSG
jgi:hypothetical protein